MTVIGIDEVRKILEKMDETRIRGFEGKITTQAVIENNEAVISNLLEIKLAYFPEGQQTDNLRRGFRPEIAARMKKAAEAKPA